VFNYFRDRKLPVAAVQAGDFNEIRGVNTYAQLQEAERIYTLRATTNPPECH
jgi:bifunctional N-acetylglucosamine-1-phosphate-uridyltransferase/glucosamine-1-phosphate-acetyltransferase GlmU-like protein